jgi:hypothetical protein
MCNVDVHLSNKSKGVSRGLLPAVPTPLLDVPGVELLLILLPIDLGLDWNAGLKQLISQLKYYDDCTK